MKKKEIEKIPWLGARKTDKRYYVNADWRELEDGTRVFLVELYFRKEPGVRFAFDSDGCATYEPEKKKWTERDIYDDYYYTRREFGKVAVGREREEDFYISKKAKEKIHDALEDRRTWSPWMTAIKNKQQAVKEDRESEREFNAKKKSKSLRESVPKRSWKFTEWAKTQLPRVFTYDLPQKDIHFLTCSACGYRRIVKNAWKEERKCPECGRVGEYMPETECRNGFKEREDVYDVQAMEYEGKKGLVITLYEMTKEYRIGAPEKYTFDAYSQAFYFKGRLTPDRLFRDTGWTTKAPRGTYSYADGRYVEQKTRKDKIRVTDTAIEEIRKSPFKYCGFGEYGKDIEGYLNAYLRDPKLEYFAKIKVDGIINEIIRKKELPELDQNARSVAGKMKIYKDRLQDIRESENQVLMWKVCQAEKETGRRFTEKATEALKMCSEYTLETVLKISKYVSPDKAIKYVAEHKESFQRYRDYLEMKDALGYDMKDKIILFPKNFEEAHNRAVLERDKEKNETRAEEKRQQFKNIAKNRKKLEKIYNFEADGFLIRPAKDAGEIVMEGAALHHCVGATDTYMDRHNKGESYILFMRREEAPEVPFCTIEIKGNEIKQWYEAYDKKPDEEVIAPVLEEYVQQLAV